MHRLLIPLGLSILMSCGETTSGVSDANSPPDSSAASIDAALDGPSPASLQLEAVILSPVGAVDLTVENVLVTFVKPSDTGDEAGFAVQAEKDGPALYVVATAATPAVTPTVGDRISFHVTAKEESFGAARATTIDNFSTSATDIDIEPLRKDVSVSTVLASEIQLYESELIHIEGTIAGSWEAAATGHQRAPLTTAGITTTAVAGAGGLWLRLPVPLFDLAGANEGCTVTLDGILWRFGADPQPSSYIPSEVVVSCP